eukprot:2578866-Pleurochrysis_carterae.AAC.1
MSQAFQSWKKRLGLEYNQQMRGKKEEERGEEREKTYKTYGIKHWGRVRSMISIKTPVMGALGHLRLTSSIEELLPYHTIPYHSRLIRASLTDHSREQISLS